MKPRLEKSVHFGFTCSEPGWQKKKSINFSERAKFVNEQKSKMLSLYICRATAVKNSLLHVDDTDVKKIGNWTSKTHVHAWNRKGIGSVALKSKTKKKSTNCEGALYTEVWRSMMTMSRRSIMSCTRIVHTPACISICRSLRMPSSGCVGPANVNPN